MNRAPAPATPQQTVAAVYAAFQRGDIPAILEQLAPDVRWEHWSDHRGQQAGVPWLRPLSGRDAVPAFFAELARMQFHAFEVRNIMVGGHEAASTCFVDISTASGRRYQDEEIHHWTFNEAGQISGFRHYVDTAKHIEAAQPG